MIAAKCRFLITSEAPNLPPFLKFTTLRVVNYEVLPKIPIF